MKLFISADIEGVSGIASWEEADPGHAHYPRFRDQMTSEVVAACEGAVESGAKEIVVKDAHWNARNIDAGKLPRQAKVIRGWASHPYCMMAGIDSTFDAALFIGYHSGGGKAGNPLAHTLTSSRVHSMFLNGVHIAEFHLNANAALTNGVPIVFLSGDQALCDEVKVFDERITTLATSAGIGNAVCGMHPQEACEHIHLKTKKSLEKIPSGLQMPDSWNLEIEFANAVQAEKGSFYPGVERLSGTRLGFQTQDYFEVLRTLQFVI